MKIHFQNEFGFGINMGFFHFRQREPEILITHVYLYSYLGHFVYPQGAVNWYEFKYEVRSEMFKHFSYSLGTLKRRQDGSLSFFLISFSV